MARPGQDLHAPRRRRLVGAAFAMLAAALILTSSAAPVQASRSDEARAMVNRSASSSACCAARAPASTPTPATLPQAMVHEFDGRDLKLGRTLARNSAYTRFAASYRSGDLRISGVMIIPRGPGPFPVVVLAHGYIDPDIYVSGQGFRREQDALARRGFAVLHVDYRNHAASDQDPANGSGMRMGYAVDVVNAAMAVRTSRIPRIDTARVGLLGRSMGGGVGLAALVMKPEAFDAAVFYASTSSDPVDNFNRWMRADPQVAASIIKRWGDPRRDRRAWDEITPRRYFSRITAPVLMIHGMSDDSCPVSWARATQRSLLAAGVRSTLKEYPGEGHYMLAAWPDSMRRSADFLTTYLRQPGA